MDTLYVKILRSDASLKLVTSDDTIQIESASLDKFSHGHCDFAAWLFMPVAMRRGMNIHIEGSGSQATIANARRMSDIWEAWMPEKLSAINVSFDEVRTPQPSAGEARNADLCFYSGGIDSTYSILKRHQEGKQQTLLTVFGMDYELDREDEFAEMLEKTRPFADLAGKERLVVKTDAYHAYQKYRANVINNGHISHIFVLAGIGHLFSERFDNLIVAADARLDQQFVVHPNGSNDATNHLFDDGECRLSTDSSDVSRSEKLPLLATSDTALNSLTFCVNHSIKPKNCGLCGKCIRTKLLFLIATGSIPDIFIERNIPGNWLESFNHKRGDQLFLSEIILRAQHSGRIGQVPGGQAIYESLKGLRKTPLRKSSSRLSRQYRKLKKMLRM